MTEIYSIYYDKVLSDKGGWFTAIWIVGRQYNTGDLDYGTLSRIEGVADGFKLIFDNGWEMEVPLKADTEIVYKPKEEKEDADKQSQDN